MVRSLALPHGFESIPDITAAQIRTKLRGTLLLMTNLKYVSITAGHAFRYPGLDVSLLTGCPFRLHGLWDASPGLGNPMYLNVCLSEQQDIRSWRPAGLCTLSSLQMGVLPHLTELTLMELYLPHFTHQWPLQTLTIHFQYFKGLDTTKSFHVFQDTLTTLNCHGFEKSPGELEQHMVVITKGVPKLKHLELSFVVDDKTVRSYLFLCYSWMLNEAFTQFDPRRLTSSISQLLELETLVLVFGHGENDGLSVCNDDSHAREVAKEFVAGCPSLRQITLGTAGPLHLPICFFSSPDGGVHLEDFITTGRSQRWHA